jgi:hypothetical protein
VGKIQLVNVEYFNYFGNVITNGSICTHEIISRIAMAKSLQQEEGSFYKQIGLKFKEETSSYIWNITLYGAETWTFQKEDQKHLRCFKMDTGEGWR